MVNDEKQQHHKQQDLDELTYIISHDLQEPLRMITSYVQLLNKRYSDKLDDNAKDYIKYAVEGSNRLKQMMDDLLTYSRIGRQDFRISEFEPAEIIESVKKLLNKKHSVSGYSLQFNFIRNYKLKADKSLLIQLLYNLADNSLKFNNRDNPVVNINFSENEENWIISVEDNGFGIDKEYHGKIFGLFQKLHNHEEYSGSGIGLAVCEKIVRKHNGSIKIDSELNKGSTFHVSLKKIIKA